MALRGTATHFNAVHFLSKDITFADDGETLSLGYLPAGAAVIDAFVIVSTAFNSGTSDVLDIGYADDGDEYATDLDLTTAGKIAADELATAGNLLYTADETQITAAYTSAGTAPTAGAGTVVVLYVPTDNAPAG